MILAVRNNIYIYRSPFVENYIKADTYSWTYTILHSEKGHSEREERENGAKSACTWNVGASSLL